MGVEVSDLPMPRICQDMPKSAYGSLSDAGAAYGSFEKEAKKNLLKRRERDVKKETANLIILKISYESICLTLQKRSLIA